MLIIVEQTFTDEMTYEHRKHTPMEYESLEDATRDFQIAHDNADITTERFVFGGSKFYTQRMYDEYPPEFLTLEEWIEKHKCE
jgi:hypothetical protein